MSEFPLTCHTLGKRAPVQVVLIHGLFTNSGYWVPYLKNLGNFQVTLLNVDYAAMFEAGVSLPEVAQRADEMIGAKPAHLIAHSFGCWPGLHLKSSLLSRSFICPTFASRNVYAEALCTEIGRRTAVDSDEIEALVAFAVDYNAQHVNDLEYRSTDNFYLPSDDPYFRYVKRLVPGVTHAYRGGHFDVSGAVDVISERLM